MGFTLTVKVLHVKTDFIFNKWPQWTGKKRNQLRQHLICA